MTMTAKTAINKTITTMRLMS